MPSLRSSPDRKGLSGAWELLPPPTGRECRGGREDGPAQATGPARHSVARPGAAVARAGLPSTPALSAWPLQSH